jgi:two-component system, OmpR family, sensor kinase
VSHDRLTRHELTWLLAQEARGAAKTLRDEVVRVRPGTPEPAPEPVETTLDALDDAIEMLSELNTGSRGKKARRGRIDLAALLYEIAPDARIAIEPGAGTEVFGDEADLRRMVNLLVTQAGSQAVVHIRRHRDWVKITVDLGPDAAAIGELERRWLSRMATRHGGSFELDGGTQSILLQADGASDQREVHELRKELEQAQQLGEAYARELATVLDGGDVRTEPPPSRSIAEGAARLDVLRGAFAAFERVCRGTAEAARTDALSAGKLDGGNELAQSLTRRAQSLTELASDLAAFGDCNPDEVSAELDLAALCSAAEQMLVARAGRRGVSIELSLPQRLSVVAPKGMLEVLLRQLLLHAVMATPRGGAVRLSAYVTEVGTVVSVEDGGPPVPEAARTSMLRHTADPSSLGRPAGFSLLAAHVVAGALGSELELREGAHGATEAWFRIASS